MKWTPDESSSKYEENAVLRPGAIDFVRKCILRVCSSFFCWLPAQGVFRCPFKLNDLDVLPVNHIHTHAQTPSVSIIRRVHTFLPIDVYKYAHKKYRVQRKKLTLRRNRYYKYVSILPIINAVYCSSVVRMTGWEQMNGKTVRNRSKRIPLMFLKTMFSIVGGTYRERERVCVISNVSLLPIVRAVTRPSMFTYFSYVYDIYIVRCRLSDLYHGNICTYICINNTSVLSNL